MKIGVVVVSYGHEKEVKSLLGILRGQLQKNDKVVVVDNKPPYKFRDTVGTNNLDYLLEHDNGGFAVGCNIGVGKIIDEVDIIVLLNPDVVPTKAAFDAIRTFDTKKFAACMPLVTMPDDTINCAGNVVHTSGLSWCDKIYQPQSVAHDMHSVNVISGACAAVSSVWWKKLGGLDENYFMYYEDTDLSSRILLMGGKIALLPAVTVRHDYDFSKGDYKWLYLERNVPLYIVKNWPLSVILVFLLQNIFIGIGLWVLAMLQGRLSLKIKSTAMFWRALPTFYKERKLMRSKRRITGYEFAKTLYPVIDTPVLGGPLRNKLIQTMFRLYYRLALGVLKLVG